MNIVLFFKKFTKVRQISEIKKWTNGIIPKMIIFAN